MQKIMKIMLVPNQNGVQYMPIRTDCRSRISVVEYTDDSVRQCFKEHGGHRVISEETETARNASTGWF